MLITRAESFLALSSSAFAVIEILLTKERRSTSHIALSGYVLRCKAEATNRYPESRNVSTLTSQNRTSATMKDRKLYWPNC